MSHVEFIMDRMDTEKVWDSNGLNPEWAKKQLVAHMIYAGIAKRNKAGQAVLVDGWTYASANNYVINGDS